MMLVETILEIGGIKHNDRWSGILPHGSYKSYGLKCVIPSVGIKFLGVVGKRWLGSIHMCG